MQTFLPYRDFEQSASCLDNKRLGKQRVEAMQLLNIVTMEGLGGRGWHNHPAAKMWRGWPEALGRYMNACIDEWESRGFNNTMNRHIIQKDKKGFTYRIPEWINESFCRSHQSNLLRKDPEWYSQFGWDVPNNLEYVWPVR